MDDKFKNIIAKLRSQKPNDLQVKKWKLAVDKELGVGQQPLHHPSAPSVYWGQLIAAVFAGIVIGGILFGQSSPDVSAENLQIAYEDATTEVIYTNL